MKKVFYTLLALILAKTFVYSQVSRKLIVRENFQINQKIEKKIINQRYPAKPLSSQSRTVIWYNDFSNPNDWLMTHQAGTADWQIDNIGPTGPYSYGPLTSTTASNGFAYFDSDSDCSGNQIASIQNVNPINCSGYSNVKLTFEEYYKRWYDSTFVYVSNNGTTWTKYVVHGNFTNDQETANGQVTSIDISATAGNQPTVYIKFTFYSPSSMGQNAGCGYWWQIDDVKIERITDNDIECRETFLNIDGWDWYDVIPVKHLDTVYTYADVKNVGLQTQTNIVLNVNVNNGAYTATSLPYPSLAPGANDTLYTYFKPTDTQPMQYIVNYSVTQQQNDQNPSNNIGQPLGFISDKSAFFRTINPTQLITSYSFQPQVPAVSGMEFAATYHCNVADRIDSIVIPIYKVKGNPSIQGKLYSINLQTGVPTLVASTSVVPLTNYPFTGQPMVKTLAFTTPYNAVAGTFYYASVRITGTFPGDTVSLGLDGQFPGDGRMAAGYYLKVGQNWGWYTVGNYVPFIGIKTKSEQKDVGVVSILTPTDACTHSTNETVTVVVKNFGDPLDAGQTIPITLKLRLNGTPYTENYTLTNTLPTNGTFNYTFTQTLDLSDVDNYRIISYTGLADDVNRNNDTTYVNVSTFGYPTINDLGPNVEVCPSQSVELVVSTGNNYTYQWYFGNTLLNNNTNTLEVTNTNMGSGKYKVVVSRNGCSVADSINITFLPLPQAYAGVDDQVCYLDVNYPLILASFQNYNTVVWSTSGNGTFDNVNATNPTYTISSDDITAGSVTLTAIATNNCGSDTSSITLTFISDAYVNAGPDITVYCGGGSVQLIATGAINYVWTPGTLLNDSTIASPIATVNQTTEFVVEGINSCGIAYDTIVVYVDNNLPTVEITASADTICKDDVVILTATPGFVSYVWSTGETTNEISGDISNMTVGIMNKFIVTITDENNCTASDTIEIFMDDCVGTPEYEALIEGIYPNPATDKFNIQLKSNNVVVQIFDIKGRMVMSKFFAEGGIKTIELRGLTPGIYSVRVSDSRISTTFRLYVK